MEGQARASMTREYSTLFDEGFHGDKHLMRLVDYIVPQVEAFIETGTNAGTTSRYMASKYPGLPVYSCEPDEATYQGALGVLGEFSNVRLFQQESPGFLYDLHKSQPALCQQRNLYWLDAHGYGFRWPLRDEVRFITERMDSGYIMIDDFKVPGRPEFKYSKYDGEVCDLKHILPALSGRHAYEVVFPNYTEHTSRHHPLVGVVLLAFGIPHFGLPLHLQNKFKTSRATPERGPQRTPLGSELRPRHLPGDPGRAVPEAIREFRANPSNAFLVSFPRTGSHWLRMLIELYFDRPLLVRSFFNFSHQNYLLLHTHDLALSERPRSVIYLYRDPVDTVYSQVRYHKQDYRSPDSVIQWSQHYALHLLHWLVGEQFTRKKTVLTYEDLCDDLDSAFQKVCEHFGEPFVPERLHAASKIVTKRKVEQKVALYDTQIMNTKEEYRRERSWFRAHQDELVWATVKSVSRLMQGDEQLLEILRHD